MRITRVSVFGALLLQLVPLFDDGSDDVQGYRDAFVIIHECVVIIVSLIFRLFLFHHQVYVQYLVRKENL